MYQRILVPIDDGPTAGAGLDEALRMAALAGGRLRLLHVLDAAVLVHGFEPAAVCCNDVMPRIRHAAEDILEHGRSRARAHRLMLCLVSTMEPRPMRTTVTIDDELFAKATKLAGPLDRSAMVREGLKALIERESAKRLAGLGGTQPNLGVAARRRGESAS
jgi:Arc/MetJ family transcription regulator